MRCLFIHQLYKFVETLDVFKAEPLKKRHARHSSPLSVVELIIIKSTRCFSISEKIFCQFNLMQIDLFVREIKE